jgi:hypothetical protein
MARRKSKAQENVLHIVPTSEELKTEPETTIAGTGLSGSSLGSLLFYTDNLHQFSFIPGNRIVREPRIQKLSATMKAWGWLYNQPMCVTPEGGIIDGQGRYMSAQRTGNVGAFFTILDPDIPERDAIKIFNEAQESWSFEDYFSGLMTAKIDPYDKLWHTWESLSEEFQTTLSATAFLSAFGVYRNHLKGEFLPEDYDYREGLATIREIAQFAEACPGPLGTAFKHTKTISVYREIRKLTDNGWRADNVIRTLRASHTPEKRQTWRDGLTSSAPLGRRLAFADIHNWKKQSAIFTPPAEWMTQFT